MTTLFNKAVVGAMVLSTIVAPFSSFAAEAGERGQKSPKAPNANFCANINSSTVKLLSNLDTKVEKKDVKEKGRLSKLTEARVVRDEERKQNREEQVVKHDTRFEALTSKADTDAKKAGVVAFKAAVASATAKRIAAVDAAVKAHRDGVDALVKGKFTALDGSTATLKQSIEAAIATAKSECAVAGANGATVRTKLMAAVKSAQDTFKANKSDTAIKTQLDALNAARKTAVDAAMAQFKTDMQKASADLKLAFGAK